MNLRKSLIFPAGCCLICLQIHAGEINPDWGYGSFSMNGTYMLYGGSLGDIKNPTNEDARILMDVHGKVAESMFKNMGKDVRNVCASELGERLRTKENVECRKSKKGGYICSFGFDLKTGKSIGGIIC